MDNAHAPTPRSRKLRARPRGAPRGNQNARKHGRYSKLKPADRFAPLYSMLRSYGLKESPAPGGFAIEDLLDDPKTNIRLLYALLQATIQLVQVHERIRRQ